MKKFALIVVAAMISVAVFGQTVQNSMVELNKIPQPGVSIVLNNYKLDVVDGALKSRLEKIGSLKKGSSSKGFTIYLNQPFVDFGTQNYNIYTQLVVSKKSNSVTLNLLVDKGNDNFASPNNDPELTQKMKDFLTNFTTYLSEYDLNLKLKAQTAEVEKLNKEYKSLVSDVEKLKKQLSAKENSLSAKEAALNKAKAALEGLKK